MSGGKSGGRGSAGGKSVASIPASGAVAEQNVANILSGAGASDGNIANVGIIEADVIQSDADATGLNVNFDGNTTTNKITLKDNLADALNVTEGANSYLKFNTANSNGEFIAVGKPLASPSAANGLSLHLSPGVAITGISQHASDPVVTAAGHGFVQNQIIGIDQVQGMGQINPDRYENGGVYVVKTVVDANNFVIKAFSSNLNTSGFPAYTSGGKTAARQGFFGVNGQFPAFSVNTLNAFSPGGKVEFNGEAVFGQAGARLLKTDQTNGTNQVNITTPNNPNTSGTWTYVNIGTQRNASIKFTFGGGHTLANNGSHTIICGNNANAGYMSRLHNSDVIVVTKDTDTQTSGKVYDVVSESVTTNGHQMATLPNAHNGQLAAGTGAITAANPAVFTTTADHGLLTDDWVFLNGITGTGWVNMNSANQGGVPFKVTKINATQFTLLAPNGVALSGAGLNTSNIGGHGANNISFSTGPAVKFTITNKSGGAAIGAGEHITFNFAAL